MMWAMKLATGAVVDTWQPKPVITKTPSDGEFNTSVGTIHLILGGGGTSEVSTPYGVDHKNGLPQAKVITKPNRPIPGKEAGLVHQGGGRRVGGRHLVRAARHRDRLRRSGVRLEPGSPGVKRRSRSAIIMPPGGSGTYSKLRVVRDGSAREGPLKSRSESPRPLRSIINKPDRHRRSVQGIEAWVSEVLRALAGVARFARRS